jgi:hypothetical protein
MILDSFLNVYWWKKSDAYRIEPLTPTLQVHNYILLATVPLKQVNKLILPHPRGKLLKSVFQKLRPIAQKGETDVSLFSIYFPLIPFSLKCLSQVWWPLLVRLLGNVSSLLFILHLICHGLKILRLAHAASCVRKISLTFVYMWNNHVTQLKIADFCTTAGNVDSYIHSSLQWHYMLRATLNVWKALN